MLDAFEKRDSPTIPVAVHDARIECYPTVAVRPGRQSDAATRLVFGCPARCFNRIESSSALLQYRPCGIIRRYSAIPSGYDDRRFHPHRQHGRGPLTEGPIW